MDKSEFLEKLRLTLGGRIPASEVTRHVAYYEDYINTEVRKGRTEEEVLASLGDPRLIAKTIVETSTVNYTSETSGYGYESQTQDFDTTSSRSFQVPAWLSKLPNWVWLILPVIVVLLLLGIVFKILSVFAPLLLVMGAVILLVKIFRDWLN